MTTMQSDRRGGAAAAPREVDAGQRRSTLLTASAQLTRIRQMSTAATPEGKDSSFGSHSRKDLSTSGHGG